MSKSILTLALAAAIAAAGQHGMGRAHRFEPVAGDEINTIGFSNGFSVDTRTGWADLPAGLQAGLDARLTIIQFRGPLDRHWQRALEREGVATFGYLAPYAVLALVDEAERVRVATLPFVRWVGPFHAGYKLQDVLLDATGELEMTLLATPGTDAAAAAQVVLGLGGSEVVVSVSEFGTTVRFRLDAARLPELARRDEVLWIQAWTEPSVCNSNTQWVTQTGWKSSAPPDTALSTRTAWAHGVRGQGVILSTTDTGLNHGHDMFRDPAMSITPPGIWPGHRKVVAFKLYQGANAGESPRHGTHVNGTVAGDDSVTGGTSYYDGMSFKGRLYFVDLTSSSGGFVIGEDLWPLWDSVYQGRGLPDSLRPIKQHSGSWRWGNSAGTYLLMDASTDAFCWAHKDFLNIMAAGNEGSGARTIGNPSLAKDVLTVGATGNGTTANTIASFSSRGPTQDNRIKPNVMAPGVSLYSARMAPATNTYEALSGTSMATPAVNGTIGLMRCYLEQGYYPSGAAVPGDRWGYISAALLRSMAMASADPNVGSWAVPDFNIGWGRIDVDSVLYFAGDTRKLLVADDTSGLATGEYKETQFQVNSAIPLRVSLAWTDTAAAPNANPTLVNNLNLELVAPSGTFYRGNQYSGGQSTANPSGWDNVNVEECCRVNSPELGLWTLRVRGQNVATAADQPFAWTVTGDIELASGDVGVTRIVAPAGTVDTLASVAPACSLWNYGSTNASYKTYCRIGAFYRDSATVTGHAPGTRRLATFPAFSAWPRGNWTVSCSTGLAGDVDNSNDTLSAGFAVRVHDVAGNEISSPLVMVDSGVETTPSARAFNHGTVAETYNIRMQVGALYDTVLTVTGHPAGALQDVYFPNWLPAERGTLAVRCSTQLATDAARANDLVTSTVFVRVRDVLPTAIVEPAGVVDSGAVVQPVARIRNDGNVPADFSVRLRIGVEYSTQQSFAGLAPGTDTVVAFSDWPAMEPGANVVRCSTMMAGDLAFANDLLIDTVFVRVRDAGAEAILVPAGQVVPGSVIAPRARVRNFGNATASFDVRFTIDDGYDQTVNAAGVAPGDAVEVEFPGWTVPAGRHAIACRTLLAGDQYPANDEITGAVATWPDGWVEVSPMPLAPSGRTVKRGGWLALGPEGTFYAAKGYKTGDFYSYDPTADTWGVLADIPAGAEGKMPEKGCRGASDGVNAVYMTKGNNTLGFWAYDVAANTWTPLADVPEGPSGKKVKGGTDALYLELHGGGRVYLLKGYRTEFWRYNIEGGDWQQLADAPTGVKAKWDRGSWLAYDGENTIYAHKAKYYSGANHEMWKYDIAGDSWSGPLTGMPLAGLHSGSIKNKKAKDGSAGAWDDGGIWALKGGNTQMFYRYDAAADTWTEADTMPTVGSTGKKKRVKQGADLVTWLPGVLYALKGNKSLETWRYVVPAALAPRPERGGVMAGTVKGLRTGMTVGPNPVVGGFATLRFVLPRAGVAMVTVYDATGRTVLRFAAPASRHSTLPVYLRKVPAGIYLVKVEANGFTGTQKLVIQH